MNSAAATLMKENNFSFDHEDSVRLEIHGILSTLRRRAHRVWLRLSWRTRTSTAVLLMTLTSFGLSLLATFLGSP